MKSFEFRKNLKTLHITAILLCYFLSYSSMLYLWLSFLLLTFFFLFQCIFTLFVNKTLKSIIKNLVLTIISAVLTLFSINLSNKIPKNINGFMSGIFFMLGNIILVKLYATEKYRLLRKHRVSEYNKSVNNKSAKNKNCNIVWEEWKD